MLKIYLTRHGQCEDNVQGILNGHRDSPLTEKGIEQANDVAEHIKEVGISFDAVYSSPLKRAFQTAEIIAETTISPKSIKELMLIEREFGVMTGKKVADIKKICAPDILETSIVTYFLNVEGGETFDELYERAKMLIQKIKNNHKDGSILLVTHGDMGKMVYAAYYGLDWKDTLIQFHFGNGELLLLSEDSPPEDAHVFETEQHNH